MQLSMANTWGTHWGGRTWEFDALQDECHRAPPHHLPPTRYRCRASATSLRDRGAPVDVRPAQSSRSSRISARNSGLGERRGNAWAVAAGCAVQARGQSGVMKRADACGPELPPVGVACGCKPPLCSPLQPLEALVRNQRGLRGGVKWGRGNAGCRSNLAASNARQRPSTPLAPLAHLFDRLVGL